MSYARKSHLPRLQEVYEAMRMYGAFVGVPSDKTSREDGGPMDNATLAYIHETGAPAANIPARPFLRNGVKRIQKQVAQVLQNGVLDGMKGGGAPSVMRALGQAGALAQGSAQVVISTSENLAPLKPATIARRMAKRGGKEGPNRPLLDTSQLRRSITFVVRKVTR